MSDGLILLILFQGAPVPSGLSYDVAQLRVLHGVVKNQAFKNENGLLDSPEAPLEQAHLHTNLIANTGEGRESNWAAKTPYLTSNAQAQISTWCTSIIEPLGALSHAMN